MKAITLALGTVLTTATAAYAGGPKALVDGTTLVYGAAAAVLIGLTMAFRVWARKS